MALSDTDKDILLARMEALTLMKNTLGWSNEAGQEVELVTFLKELGEKVAAPAPVDIPALVAALRPELEAAAERAVRRVLGGVDGATPQG